MRAMRLSRIRISGAACTRRDSRRIAPACAAIPAASAASILAKEAREEAMARLRAELGECGSGYPSDERTITFLKEYRREHNEWPPGTRKSWKTLERLERQEPRVTLDDFGTDNE